MQDIALMGRYEEAAIRTTLICRSFTLVGLDQSSSFLNQGLVAVQSQLEQLSIRKSGQVRSMVLTHLRWNLIVAYGLACLDPCKGSFQLTKCRQLL